MGVRPNLVHIIGIRTEMIPNFQEWKREFYEKNGEKRFVRFAKKVWEKADSDKEFRDEMQEGMKEEFVMDVIPYVKAPIFGMIHVYHFEESSLYNHDLIWAMLETGFIEDKAQCLKIPYEDFSKYIGMDLKEVRKEGGLSAVSQMRMFLEGGWARKYPNNDIGAFDDDLKLAYALFKEMGLDVKPEDIDRYIIFEWC